MTQLVDRLNDLAAAGERAVTFRSIGMQVDAVRQQMADVAAGPLAPVLAEAVVHAYEVSDATWMDVAATFPAGFARQRSLLAFTAAFESLLGSAVTVSALARPLNEALLDDFTNNITRLPLLAAAQLEGAVRLAVAKAVRPYRVWEILEEIPSDSPEDFLERLPRILGVALDCWAQSETNVSAAARELLQRLSVIEAADVDAMFELGCDHLRGALSATDIAEVGTTISKARSYFAAAEAAEETRDDAAIYLAVCDAVLGFVAHNASLVASAVERIEHVMERRHAWLRATHKPSWLQPRLAAEIAWSELLLQLKTAADLFSVEVWMDSWQALDAVLAAYRATRSIRPLTENDTVPGLIAFVEPAIDDGFLRREAFFSALRHAVTQPQDYPGPIFDTATATSILARIEARETHSDPCDGETNEVDGDDDSDTEPGAERLYRLAPTLLRTLGTTRSLKLAERLDDAGLVCVEGIAYDSDAARLQATDPLIVPLLDSLIAELSSHESFTGYIRQTFSVLITQTLLFLKSRADLTRTSIFGSGKKGDPPYDYRRKPDAGQRSPNEGDLQRDFHQWLQSGSLQGVVQVEPINVGMGRADVMVHFGSLRYLTEMKQEDADNSRSYLEGKYLAQAAEYTNTNAPFGQLLVLDLTSKTSSSGTMRVDELTWLASHRPQGATKDRYVVAGIVTGNRVTPSGYSR
ncbi:hypothetical protein GCM10022254_64170 [Actinomadura meridiana]|uniref:Protein NO VEIN C-terminal domain-containing protein n=1 Tax=Actinomadura meridiana TaxID=559626 RepID=A0ABP8CK15_9ACTN